MQPGLRNAAKCSKIGKQGPKGTARCARCGGLWCQIRLAAGLAGLLISRRRWGLCCLAVCRVQEVVQCELLIGGAGCGWRNLLLL